MVKKFALFLIVALLVQALPPLQLPQTANAAHSAGVAAPRNASASWTGKEIRVRWDKVSQSKGYRVFRSTKPDRDFQIIHATSSANDNEYRDTSVAMGELSARYYYTVRSIGNGGTESPSTAAVSVVVPAIEKRPPSSIRTKITSTNAVTLSWREVDLAAGYKIYRSDSINGNYELIATVTGGTQIQYTDNSYAGLYLSKNRLAYYKASTSYPSGSESARSLAEPVLLKAYKFPTPRVQLLDGKVQLKWQGDDNAQSYRIYRATASRGPYVQVGQAASGATSYVDNQGFAQQTANARYYYAISAVDRLNNESIRSNSVSITVPKPPIGQPQSVSAAFQDNRTVKVSWSPVPSAAGYYVYRQVAPSSGGNGGTPARISGSAKVTGTTFLDDSFVSQAMKEDTDYTYFVSAVASNGKEGLLSDGATVLVRKPGPVNLLKNGSFEAYSEEGTAIEDWTLLNSSVSGGSIKAVQTPVASGQAAVQIVGSALPKGGMATVVQYVPVESGQSYRLSGRINVEQLADAKIQFYVDYFNADGQWVGLTVKEYKETTTGYAAFEVEGAAPADAVRAAVFAIVRGNDNNGSGTLYVDDLLFTPSDDRSAPRFWYSNPSDGATGVINQTLEISYDENIELTNSSGTDVQLLNDGNAVSAKVTVQANKLLVKPNILLAPGTTYTIHIAANAVRDAAGNVQAQAYASSFTTFEGSTLENLLQNSGFESGALGTASAVQKWTTYYDSGVTLQKTLVAEPVTNGSKALKMHVSGLAEGSAGMLSQSVKVQSGNRFLMTAQVYVEQLTNAKFQWYVDFFDAGGQWVGAQLQDVVAPTTGYETVELSGDAPSNATRAKVFLIVRGTGADAEGTIYVDETSFLSYNVDTDAPVVQSVEPPTIGEGILSNSIIGVTFDEPIDAGDSFSDIRLQSLSGTVVQTTIRIHGNELFITPTVYLQPGTEYKAILPQGAVKDASGNGLQAAYEYSFKVKNGIEILNNGDFEQSFTGWYDSVSEGGASGNQLLINGSSSGLIAQQIAATGLPQDGVSIVYQDVGVQASKTYDWSGRVHVAELQDAKFQLYVDFLNASGNVVATRIKELNQATGGYVYLEDRLTAPDGAVTARFCLVLRALAQGGGGTVIADTLSFVGEKEPDIVVPVTSLIVNGGFEEGDDNTLTGWSVFSSVNTSVGSSVYSPNAGYTEYISKSSVAARNGQYALELSASGMDNDKLHSVYQDVALQAGKPYTFSGSLWANELENAQGQLFIDFFDANGNWITFRSSNVSAITDQYHQESISGITPAGTVRARVYVILRAVGDNASGKLFADDLALTVSLDNIRNPDFERHNWGGAVADEWSDSFFNAPAPEFAVVPVEGANAGQAQKIAASQMGNGGYAWISQSNAISGGSLYSLSGKIRATKLNGTKAQLYVDFFDSNQAWVGSNSAEIGSATGDYTSLVVNGVTPGQATRAIVYCILKSEADNSEGELYVDDIHFNVFQ